jgi:hypothetical protein
VYLRVPASPGGGPLELPQRATEFLAGVVRQQIDRLTPWTANDAAFGWSAPAEAGADRVVITVAATARTMVQPIVDALIAAGAEAVAVTAAPPDAAPITVLEQHASGTLDVARVRRALVATLIVTGLLAGVSLSVAGLAGMKLASEQEELTRRIAERRVAIRLGREGDLPRRRQVEVQRLQQVAEGDGVAPGRPVQQAQLTDGALLVAVLAGEACQAQQAERR